jgi:hypothetical protein
MSFPWTPQILKHEGDVMKNHGKYHKEISGTKEKRDSKSKTSNGELKALSSDEGHHRLAADVDPDRGISFLVNFSLKGGQLEGKIKHVPTDKHIQFTVDDQDDLSEMNRFIKGYLKFRLEKDEKKPIEEQPIRTHKFADVQDEETGAVPRGEIRTRSFGVLPEGSAQHTEFLQQGQSFQLQWSFESPSISNMEGEQLHYRIVISGKNLEGGERLKIADTTGQIGFGSPLTASIRSAPLPPGTYRLEADSDFSMKSKKIAEWHSACRERRLIQVV